MIKMANGMVRWILLLLVGIGLCLGLWKFMGDGVPINDPAWVGNAIANMGEFMGWSGDQTERILPG